MTVFGKPRYPNDCPKCVWLGEFGRSDLYYCPQSAGLSTVIARFGPGPAYVSGLTLVDILPELGEARKRAITRGLLPR